MDLIGPLKKTMKDHQYVLTVTDLFTKWVIAEPLKCGSSTEVAEALVSKLYTFMVRKIITDTGRAFVNEVCDITLSLHTGHMTSSQFRLFLSGRKSNSENNHVCLNYVQLNAHIFAAMNIKHAITSADHPQSNGQVSVPS